MFIKIIGCYVGVVGFMVCCGLLGVILMMGMVVVIIGFW